MGTAEVENAINEHPAVIESAVVGYPHDIKGQGIFAYIIAQEGTTGDAEFEKSVKAVVTKVIGPIAKPDKMFSSARFAKNSFWKNYASDFA